VDVQRPQKIPLVVETRYIGECLFPGLDHLLPHAAAEAHVVIPAVIFFGVSAYRCLFPVHYKDKIVFHDSHLSFIFLTRLLVTKLQPDSHPIN
jgi:hypothetical protein